MENEYVISPLTEMVFISEIVYQLRLIDISNSLLTDNSDSFETWINIQTILIAIANISRILWPSNQKYTNRGKTLREVLEVKEDNLVSNRKIRNHFEHYDERIDEWFLKNKSSTYIDRKIDSSILSSHDYQQFSHRGYDPISKTLYFRNESFDLNNILNELNKIRIGCRKYGFKI